MIVVNNLRILLNGTEKSPETLEEIDSSIANFLFDEHSIFIMTNNAVSEIFKLIDFEYSLDSWWDSERFKIAKLLSNLEKDDWERLKTHWMNLSNQGMIQLVEALNVNDDQVCFPLLEEMISTNNAKLGSVIAGALLEMGYTRNPEFSIVMELTRHREFLSGYELKIVDQLLARLPR